MPNHFNTTNSHAAKFRFTMHAGKVVYLRTNVTKEPQL